MYNGALRFTPSFLFLVDLVPEVLPFTSGGLSLPPLSSISISSMSCKASMIWSLAPEGSVSLNGENVRERASPLARRVRFSTIGGSRTGVTIVLANFLLDPPALLSTLLGAETCSYETISRDAEENDGEPVDDLALMKRAYTNKKTGQIDDGLVREVVTLVQTQVQDEVSQLQTEDDDSTASTNLSRFRINEIVESVIGSKEEGTFGRFGSSHPVGLGRRTRSVPPSSAPPPFVDPEVLTAQLKDKDDRISFLETQMTAQQAGYEAQKRLSQQMMEMMQRMYPNEVFPNVQDP
ncbi:hypothetical protein F2Q68_00006223 [Brassica cretica]|uniref:Uncharacterized protein n=1 Tax=Brassica cretica TaxID=69181 RepID=A0A8S9JP03_BRACR|nr:hypothetical protein F2Q68_00006223 [Brassica cretica]